MSKFMVTLNDRFFEILQREAEERKISLQNLLRAVIIPEWMKSRDVKLERMQLAPAWEKGFYKKRLAP